MVKKAYTPEHFICNILRDIGGIVGNDLYLHDMATAYTGRKMLAINVALSKTMTASIPGRKPARLVAPWR